MRTSQQKDLNKLPAWIYEGKYPFCVPIKSFCFCLFVLTPKIVLHFVLYFSAYDAIVPARGKALIQTDIQIEVPNGTYGRVAPRSGLTWKNSLDVGGGVIDQDYRGNLGVILFNHSDDDFEVKKGDRIAQLICERIVYPNVVQVEKLTDTIRGSNGLGSTGIK